MILLTRLNNSRLAVNSDLIKYVEEAPDTVITLVNDEKLVVRESAQEVILRVREFRSSVLTASDPVSWPRSTPAEDIPSAEVRDRKTGEPRRG